MDLEVWLRSLGLERYEAAFRENEIDSTILPRLTAEDLKELGVGPVDTAGSSSTLLLPYVLTRTQTHHYPLYRRLDRRLERAPPR
jgi:hypothetical protein